MILAPLEDVGRDVEWAVRELDVALFRAINGWPDWMEPTFVFLSLGTKQLWVVLLLLAAFVGFVWSQKTRAGAILAMVSWPFANAACDWLKYGFQGLRPCVELQDVILRVPKLTSFGTASAHSATMMAVAVAFLFYHRPSGFVWLAIALLTGLSRVYVGVHYPSQVLLGWFVGFFVAFVAVMTWRALDRRRSLRRQEAESRPADQ